MLRISQITRELIMDKKIFISGNRQLNGEVCINGSKNAALACLAGACLTTDGEPVVLHNVPGISDVEVMCDMIRSLGKDVKVEGDVVTISGLFNKYTLPEVMTGKIRGSMYFYGLLLATMGAVDCGLPGGDRIGERPIDIHISGMKKLGAEIDIMDNRVIGSVNGLVGNTIYLRYPSVGATCNLMIAASRAKGKTMIYNAAKEPEIVDLGSLLQKMGIRVTGAGTDALTITGTESVKGGIEHSIIADRIEAGVLAIATAVSGGEVTIRNIIPYHNYPLISLLQETGTKVVEIDDGIVVTSTEELKPVSVEMMPFPGVATDLQAAIAVLALKANGISTIVDHVFQNRFQYLDELRRMGAYIERNGNTVKLYGGTTLKGCEVVGNDIRAVSALMIAGMGAEGETVIDGVTHLYRGYPNLDEKLINLGAGIEIR